MKKIRFFKDLLTERDNETYEIVRVSVGIAALLFPLLIVGGAVALIMGVSTPSALSEAFRAFGALFQDFGIFLGSAGVGLFLKRGSEPLPAQPPAPQEQ